jgi:hypothetical protein
MGQGGEVRESVDRVTGRLSSRVWPQRGRSKARCKIQAIYKPPMGIKFNTRPCSGERKAAGAGIMEKQPETVTRTREKQCETRADTTRGEAIDRRPVPRSRQQKNHRRVAAGGERTNPRLGFQPSPNWRSDASSRKNALALSPREIGSPAADPARHDAAGADRDCVPVPVAGLSGTMS